MDNFKAGDTVFLVSGAEAEYVASHPLHGHIVLEVLNKDEDDETIFSDPIHARQVFMEAPIPRINEEIKALERKREELKKEIDHYKSETIKATSESAKVMAALVKHEQLKHLEDFLAGKVTHAVMLGEWDAYKILEWTEALMYKADDYDKVPTKMRLLSLYGDSKGKLDWRLHEYSVGSYSSGDKGLLIPCVSLDEAKAELYTFCMAKFDDWRKDQNKSHAAYRAQSALVSYGFSAPEDFESWSQKRKYTSVAERISKLASELAAAQAELDKVR